MTNMKKFLMLLTVAAIALMCFTGCSVNITSIGLPADMQLEKGETAQLEISYGADKENAKADAIAKAAEGLALVWESDNEDVATVDENGNVTAVGGGEANITVSIKDANIQSVCKITVDVAAGRHRGAGGHGAGNQSRGYRRAGGQAAAEGCDRRGAGLREQ